LSDKICKKNDVQLMSIKKLVISKIKSLSIKGINKEVGNYLLV